MQYIVFWEYDPKELDSAVKKLIEFRKEIKKNPDNYAKPLTPNYTMSVGFKGFQLFEADNPEQLARMVLHYRPEVKFEVVHITETKKTVKLYQESK
ncbi:MAG: DUF3303 domain-containing protein [Candidatus Thorarchaeota archaeon]|jgi:hypothetical protein